MNEFGAHGPTRDPALGDTNAEGATPQSETSTKEDPEGEREASPGTGPDTDRPADTAPSTGRSEQAGTDAARGALSEHE